MDHKAKFSDTVAILVKAYLNGDLAHQDCACCAVGNIISTNCGYTVERLEGKSFWTKGVKTFDPQEWLNAFGTSVTVAKRSFFDKLLFRKLGKMKVKNWFRKDQITKNIKFWAEKSGYSVVSLARIENAFESAPKTTTYDQWMFDGLMAVVDVLAEIHGIDLTAKEEAKNLFVKV